MCNSRRFSLVVVLAAATCLGLHVARPGAVSAAKDAPPFYLGADISTLASVEDRGGVYMDEGKQGDALAIFMKHGWTCMRLRI
jgi:arabinogalactan endo-1,4-beta-galactosidase